MPDLDRLETLAKDAMSDESWGWEADGVGIAFIDAADPPTVLALVAEVRRLRKEHAEDKRALQRWCEWQDEISKDEARRLVEGS